MKITFKNLQNFFGDRNMILRKRDVKKWGIDEEYIYFVPANKCEDSPFSTTLHHCYVPIDDLDAPCKCTLEPTIMWFSRSCLYGEMQNEVLLKDSPYKGKLVSVNTSITLE